MNSPLKCLKNYTIFLTQNLSYCLAIRMVVYNFEHLSITNNDRDFSTFIVYVIYIDLKVMKTEWG